MFFSRILVQILNFNWSRRDENIGLKRFDFREIIIILSFKQKKASCAFSPVEVKLVLLSLYFPTINVSVII